MDLIKCHCASQAKMYFLRLLFMRMPELFFFHDLIQKIMPASVT